jgi:hypothetical protein
MVGLLYLKQVQAGSFELTHRKVRLRLFKLANAMTATPSCHGSNAIAIPQAAQVIASSGDRNYKYHIVAEHCMDWVKYP